MTRAGSILFVVAAPKEWQAVAEGLGHTADAHAKELRGPGWTLIASGVGKSRAAAAAARALAHGRFDACINLGIAGSLPIEGEAPCAIGTVIAASRSVLADEGVDTPDAWLPMSALGFSTAIGGESVQADAGLLARLSPLADRTGVIATVSTCSGIDARAKAVAARTGALVEAMEGAAVGVAALAASVPFAELRVVSNTTGDRSRQRWDLPLALGRLSRLAGEIITRTGS